MFVADVAVKSFEFPAVAVYAPNSVAKRCSFFQRRELILDNPKRLVLVGDWNAILDDKLGPGGVLVGRIGGRA